MSSTRSLGGAILAACALGACASPRIACPPQQHGADARTHSLAGASIFEGPPQQLVDLMPDLETSEWDISMNQRAARRRGESMYLVCRYHDLATTVSLPIPDEATACKVEGAASGLAALCTRPGRSASSKQD